MASADYTDVRFDYDGSLALARRLWSLADELHGVNGKRLGAAEVALWSWQGTYAQQFATRVNEEQASGQRVAFALREEARGWATSWAQAINQQNKRLRGSEVDRVRESRSGMEKFGDRFVGDDSDNQVPLAPVASVPQPPHFTPTGSLVVYCR